MAKEKISVTVDAAVLAAVDSAARTAGLSRSEMVENALRNEHLRAALQDYRSHTVPTLKIDEYAQRVYEANPAATPTPNSTSPSCRTRPTFGATPGG